MIYVLHLFFIFYLQAIGIIYLYIISLLLILLPFQVFKDLYYLKKRIFITLEENTVFNLASFDRKYVVYKRAYIQVVWTLYNV